MGLRILGFDARREEFGHRLEQIQDRLYRMAYAWSHNATLASDLVQDANFRALDRWKQLREIENFDRWMFRILANCCQDHHRRHRDTVDIETMNIANVEAGPEEEHDRNEVVARVRAAVSDLPLAQRCVLSLVDLEGFSYSEVAQILDIPMGTVMSRLARARSGLKSRLVAVETQEAKATPHLRSVK